MRTGPLRYDIDSRPKITKKAPSNVGGILLCAIGVIVVGALIILTMSGCASIDKAYVAADRITYEAIGPEYVEYVNRDEKLRDWEKSLRATSVEAWEERLTEAESK